MFAMSYYEDLERVAHSSLPWEKLDRKNILITGATGLIGSCIVEVLLSHPRATYNIYASGRNKSRFEKLFERFASSGNLHFVEHEVSQPLDGEVEYQYIIHAASGANPTVYATDPVGVMKSNLLGVINLMDYGANHGLEKFLYVSSGEVYGEGDGRFFSEDYCGFVDYATVRACYPSAKRAAETLCVSYASQNGTDVSIVRPSHVYGPNFSESDNRVYAQFIRNMLSGEDIVMKSAGTQFRSWCYVVDCASAILHVLLKGEKGEAYNIADNESNISIKDLAEMIAKIGGRKVVIDLPSDIERIGFNTVSKSVFDTHKLENLGWKISGSMYDKMETTFKKLMI